MKINGLRFIIGSGCNYNCFFCHHEGYNKATYDDLNKEKIKKLYEFSKAKNIKDISITGGEPFLYWEKLKYLLSTFSDDYFRITLNTNFSLADKYFEEMKKYKNIEYHINFTTLDKLKHEKIISKKYFSRLKENLEMYKNLSDRICLNIPVLHNINSDELIDIFNYCKKMNFKPRFLVLYPMNEEQQKYFEDVREIMSHFPKAKLQKQYSYGRFDVTSEIGNFEIVRCLCIKMECDTCKKNTYIHLTPDLNLKWCMNKEEEIEMDYSSIETIEEGFEKALERLK